MIGLVGYTKTQTATSRAGKIEIVSNIFTYNMSLHTAIARAFAYKRERKYPITYIAIDLHGVCFNSTYTQGGYAFINADCKNALRILSDRPDVKIILWSSCHKEEQTEIIKFFGDNGISVDYFNENPECENTVSGCFDQKFYFSILLDDKAGFDPNEDWGVVIDYFSK